jgi:predicted peroxiredoxin
MGKYVLIESRDPFDSADWSSFRDLALGLARQGNDVTVFLAQNGVLPTRSGSKVAAQVSELAGDVTVLADEFSLRERGIPAEGLVKGVRPAGIDTLVTLLMEDGRKAIWH